MANTETPPGFLSPFCAAMAYFARQARRAGAPVESRSAQWLRRLTIRPFARRQPRLRPFAASMKDVPYVQSCSGLYHIFVHGSGISGNSQPITGRDMTPTLALI